MLVITTLSIADLIDLNFYQSQKTLSNKAFLKLPFLLHLGFLHQKNGLSGLGFLLRFFILIHLSSNAFCQIWQTPLIYLSIYLSINFKLSSLIAMQFFA